MGGGERGRVVVIGSAGRDLVLRVPGIPDSGGSAPVLERIERLGGKGANQAVGLRQLGADVALIAVIGEDAAGAQVHDDAVGSGLDVSGVVRRGTTALFLDLVGPDGDRRLVEDMPDEALLTADDIAAAADLIRSADTVSLQLQQPPDALLAAARLARDAGARIVLDGAVGPPARDELLQLADVLRADAEEASLLAGREITGRDDAVRAAEELLRRDLSIVALAVPGEGNVVVWADGHRFFPYPEPQAVDPTGAGDAFVAGLITGLRRGSAPEQAGALATEAASATVVRLGGRPDLRGLGAGNEHG